MRRQYGRHPLRACSQAEGFRIGCIRRIFNIVFPCSYGGIGRRGRFRFCWATPVQVQVLLAAFFYSIKNGMAALSAQWPYRFLSFIMFFFLLFILLSHRIRYHLQFVFIFYLYQLVLRRERTLYRHMPIRMPAESIRTSRSWPARPGTKS